MPGKIIKSKCLILAGGTEQVLPTGLREPGDPPLLVVATGPYAGEGFDCPPLDTLFLAAPVAYKGKLVQYAGLILRPYDGKTTAEVHDYVDEDVGAWR